jgi:hypothetical protein
MSKTQKEQPVQKEQPAQKQTDQVKSEQFTMI